MEGWDGMEGPMMDDGLAGLEGWITPPSLVLSLSLSLNRRWLAPGWILLKMWLLDVGTARRQRAIMEGRQAGGRGKKNHNNNHRMAIRRYRAPETRKISRSGERLSSASQQLLNQRAELPCPWGMGYCLSSSFEQPSPCWCGTGVHASSQARMATVTARRPWLHVGT